MFCSLFIATFDLSKTA